jgi:PDDEXK-like domain of unknown function (DUF3799)
VTTVEMNTTGDAVVRDLPHADYLAHAALSASGAKVLVQPGGPARFHHERTHPRPPTDAFDLGHLVHGAVLGVGPEVLVVDAPDWRTAAAKKLRDEARAAGRIACLTSDARQVEEMAGAVRAHPIASRLLHPDSGEPEVSLFYRDPEHGVDRRARIDWLRRPDDTGRLIVVDLKTAASASPAEFARAAARYGYAQQAAFYRDLVVGLGLGRSAPFVFVVVEKEPPYLVSVVQFDEAAMQAGEALNRKAMRLFRDCTESGSWPGLTEAEVATISLPPWTLMEAQEATW